MIIMEPVSDSLSMKNTSLNNDIYVTIFVVSLMRSRLDLLMIN